jgi:hypothetical protein
LEIVVTVVLVIAAIVVIVATGGSFFDGFEEGAFSGALIGAVFGGIGGIGQILGKSYKVLERLGKIAKIIPTVSKISGVISLGMAGFDLLSLGVSLFDPESPLVKFNKKLHESSLYNGFQITISALAVFTAGFTKGMKNPICFVAGTMVLSAMGLKAIETIQPGDQVIATNPDTFQTEEKKVVETYINKTTCIVKIIIQNEEIYTTMNHPFYVKGQGFLAAGKLSMGDEIMNASGGSYPVECVELEEKQEVVYNFQVEDYHTYYVGENRILVHNDCPEGEAPTKDGLNSVDDIVTQGKKALDNFDVNNAYVKPKHLSTTGGNGAKFLGDSKGSAEAILRDAMKNGKITSVADNGLTKSGNSSYEIIIDAGKTIGTKGENLVKIVISSDGGMLSAYPIK